MPPLKPSTGLWRSLRVVSDLAAGAAAAVGAFLLRVYLPLPFTMSLLPADRLRFVSGEWLVVVLSQPLILYLLGFYDPPARLQHLAWPRRLLAMASVQGLSLMALYFLTNRPFPRTVLVLFVILNFLLLLGSRALLGRFRPPPVRRVAIVGAGRQARELARALRSNAWMGFEVAGFVPSPEDVEGGDEPEPAEEAEQAEEGSGVLGPRLGALEDLPEILAAGTADDVVLAARSEPWKTELLDRLAGGKPRQAGVLLLPGPFESLIGRVRHRWVHDLPLIEVVRQAEAAVNRPLKRALDLLVGSLLAVLCLPVVAVCAAAVKLSSPGSVVYRQERVGLHGRRFWLWKLRTMHDGAEAATGEVLATENDPRLTPVGGFLRRFRLDEIPQLAQVLSGHMSLVGPRPERPRFVERFLEETPGYAERFALPPGVTGLAQVNGDYHSSAENKLRYDLAYLANWSLWLDLAILFRTVKIVLTSRGT